MTSDIGENLVGAYLRYIEECDVVVHNTQINDEQGEIDVIGMKFGPEPETIFCEVTTHILGMQYGSHEATIAKVDAKIRRASTYAKTIFGEGVHRYEIWSPVVPTGKLTQKFTEMEQRYSEGPFDVEFVINNTYTQRVQRLIEHARKSSKATSDPAYRMLQLLTRLKGPIQI